MSSHKKISILGSGRVGSSIAYSLILEGLCSEIVLVDIDKELAQGESYAPDAIYIIVSNPVDVLTYAVQEITGLPKERVIGTGTLLDSSRLRSILAERAKVSPSNVHGYVFGEHGDSSFVPWSLTSIAGMPLEEYDANTFAQTDEIQEEVRLCGANVIKNKGATNYAIAMLVCYLASSILKDTKGVLTVSTRMDGQYGIEDVCLSIPAVIGSQGIIRTVEPELSDSEKGLLIDSANILKDVIQTIEI